MRYALIVLTCWLVAIPLAAGNDDESPTAASAAEDDAGSFCERDPMRAQFDFWLGDWNVYDPNGNLAGVNRITRTEAGCLIREQWAGSTGGTGFSMNFWDADLRAWRQIWMSPSVQIDYHGGLDDGGAMVLEGSITYLASGDTFDFRGTWTPQSNGEVIQHFQQVNPETGTWTDWFVGRYVRAADDANADADALRSRSAVR